MDSDKMSNRVYSLDLLRVIATIFIIFHHYQQNSNLQFDKGINFCFGSFYFGNMVELFFVLSGFLTFKGMLREEQIVFGSWIGKKYLRLIPLVALSVFVYEVLVVLYVKILGDYYFGTGINLWGAIITAVGIQDGWVFINPIINNPVWYVSVLLLCYIMYWIVIKLSLRFQVSPIYGFFIMILIGCAISSYNINLPFLNLGSSRGYYAFFTGCLLGHMLYKKMIGSALTIFCFFSVILISFLIISSSPWISGGTSYILTFWFFPSLIVIFTRKPIIKLFNWKIIGEAGKITYSVYIWHVCCYMVMRIMIGLMGYDSSVIMQRKAMYLYGIFCFIVGTISYYFIEKPTNRIALKRMSIGDKSIMKRTGLS